MLGVFRILPGIGFNRNFEAIPSPVSSSTSVPVVPGSVCVRQTIGSAFLNRRLAERTSHFHNLANSRIVC